MCWFLYQHCQQQQHFELNLLLMSSVSPVSATTMQLLICGWLATKVCEHASHRTSRRVIASVLQLSELQVDRLVSAVLKVATIEPTGFYRRYQSFLGQHLAAVVPMQVPRSLVQWEQESRRRLAQQQLQQGQEQQAALALLPQVPLPPGAAGEPQQQQVLQEDNAAAGAEQAPNINNQLSLDELSSLLLADSDDDWGDLTDILANPEPGEAAAGLEA